MLKAIKAYLRTHLDFSHAEVNGSLLLIPLVIVSTLGPYFLKKYYQSQHKMTDYKEAALDWKKELEGIIVRKEEVSTSRKIPGKHFTFDPNRISESKIRELGFSDKTADNWLRFLKAKGCFKTKADLLKIYGISQKRVGELWDYILIDSIQLQKNVANERIKSSKLLLKNKADINKVTQSSLVEIRGIGKVLSSRIIKYKELLGGFHSIEQLQEVYGLSNKVILRLNESFEVKSPIDKRLNINTDSVANINRHPYLSFNQARAIVNYRKQHGDYHSPEDLAPIDIISDSTILKITPYIRFD